jgi:hypothetical protein
MAICSGVSPLSATTEPVPRTIPLVGTVSTLVTPFARPTKMPSLYGLMLYSARMCGLNEPTSRSSRAEPMDSMSMMPTAVSGSIMPG